MKKVLFFLVPLCAWATPQMVTISASNSGGAAIPTTGIFASATVLQIDGRIPTLASGDAAGWSGYNQFLFQIGNYFGAGSTFVERLYVVSAGVSYTMLLEGFGSSLSCPAIAFGQDSVYRITASSATSTLICEIWNVDGTNYHTTSMALTPFVGIAAYPTIQLGDASHAMGKHAFVRAYSTALPLHSTPPCGNGTGGVCRADGNLWDYEFGGNLNDSSGNNINLTPTGSFAYSTAPSYPPGCSIAPVTTGQYSGRVGQAFPLTAGNSIPLNGESMLTYAATVLSSGSTTGAVQPGSPAGTITVNFSPGAYTLSAGTTVSPTIAGVAGSYVIQETVTDSSSQSTSCGMKYGAVSADPTGTVSIANPIHASILGPMKAMYANPWAAEWQQHEAYADLLLLKLAGTSPYEPQYVDYWNQAQAGTITVTGGSAAVVGVGTSFTTLFCQGPAYPVLPKSTSLVTGSWTNTSGNVWQIALGGSPDAAILFFNNTVGTLESSLGAVTGANEWYWSSSTLYIYSVGSPASTYTAPGISQLNDLSTKIDVWNPIYSGYGLPAGVTARTSISIAYCTDNTHLTMAGTFLTDTNRLDGSGLGYAYEEEDGEGAYGTFGWWNGIAQGNYYQVDEGFLRAYYRSGIDDYLLGFRTMADRWWSFPGINKGIQYETSSGNSYELPNRSTAAIGLFLRQAECGVETGSTCPNSYGPPYPYWPGITSIVNLYTGQGTPIGGFALLGTCYSEGPTVPCSQDVRENSWALATIALDAMYNPSNGGSCSLTAGTNVTQPSQRCYDFQAINNDFWSRWTPCQGMASQYGTCSNNEGLSNSPSSWNTATTAALTVGSNVVTASGASAGQFNSCSPTACSSANPPNAIIFCNSTASTSAPVLPSQCDPTWYYAVYNSGTSKINLTDVTGQNPANYVAGTACASSACSGVGWQTGTQAQVNNLIFFFHQPYMMGLQQFAYYRSYLAIQSALPSLAAAIPGYALQNYNYFAANLAPGEGGPWYIISPFCGNGNFAANAYPGLTNCDAGSLGAREELEWLNIPVWGFELNPTYSGIISEASILEAGIYAQLGELNYQSGLTPPNILSDFVSPGYMYTGTAQQKWFGLGQGIGVSSVVQALVSSGSPQGISAPKSIGTGIADARRACWMDFGCSVLGRNCTSPFPRLGEQLNCADNNNHSP